MKYLSSTILVLITSTYAQAQTINADVWADNWYALYVGEELVKEDSVPFNTERSFNKDSFSFAATYPVQLNLIIKDYKEDDSGLEYIGSGRQQIGDGGFSAQFFDANSNKPVAVSNESWRCLAIHRAPLNKSCERSTNPTTDCQTDISGEPDNWKAADFDDSGWPNAVLHSAEEVRPRRGYDEVDWHDSAKLIWSDDLEIDNTILCRASIAAPE
jgi:hypothetical protein